MRYKYIVSRILPFLVVTLALLGFIILAWNAYQENSEIEVTEIPVIKADPSPVKEKPEDEEGMKIPHRDKEIYNIISSDKKTDGVETLLPPDTKAEQNPEHQAVSSSKQEETAEVPVSPEEPVIVKTNEETKADVINENTVPVPKFKPAKEPDIIESTAKEKTIKAMQSGVAVQLGAYKTSEDADDAWKKIQNQYSDILGKLNPYIVKVNISGQDFYRLRAVPVANKSEGNKICDKLKSKGQGCFVVN